jgi:hypothetical protein
MRSNPDFGSAYPPWDRTTAFLYLPLIFHDAGLESLGNPCQFDSQIVPARADWQEHGDYSAESKKRKRLQPLYLCCRVVRAQDLLNQEHVFSFL